VGASVNCPIAYVTYPAKWDDVSLFCDDSAIANWPADYKVDRGSDSIACKCKDQSTSLFILLVGNMVATFAAILGSMQRAKREWDSPYVKCPNFFAHSCPLIFNLSTLSAYDGACYTNIPGYCNAKWGVGFVCVLCSLFCNVPSWVINLIIPAPPDEDVGEDEGTKAEMTDVEATTANI